MIIGRFAITTLAVVVSVLASDGAHSAQVFRWVDANGRVHFEDKPRGNSAKALSMPTVSGQSAAPTDAERAEAQRHLLQVFANDREEKALAAKKAKEAAAEREKKCHIAKDDLQQLRTAGVLYDLDATGNRRVLTDQEHAEAHQKAEATVAQWCD